MRRKAIWALSVSVLLSVLAVGQEDYLDVFTVKVKPEKRAQFDAIAKRVAVANRQNKGDNWLALETVYGEGNVVSFISTRRSYADIEKAQEVFMGALNKAYGPGTQKLFQDFGACLESSRSEFRRRRWDLSNNVRGDSAAMAKLIGGSRWVRTTVVHVKPGQVANFEALAKDVKTAREKAKPPQTTLVSQALAGQKGTVFYVSSLQSSLGGFDTVPTVQQLLGDEGYEKFLKANAEAVSNTEIVINRFVPEFSNPPQDVAAVAPDFWNPKPTATMPKKKTNTER